MRADTVERGEGKVATRSKVLTPSTLSARGFTLLGTRMCEVWVVVMCGCLVWELSGGGYGGAVDVRKPTVKRGQASREERNV